MTDDSGSAGMDETVSFNVLVPEFSGMVAIVMAVSIMMIVAIAKLSAKIVLKIS